MNSQKAIKSHWFLWRAFALSVFGIWALFFMANGLVELFGPFNPLSSAINTFWFEPTVLALTWAIMVCLTCRPLYSFCTLTIFYVVFMFINVEMVKIFGTVLSPSDIKYVSQLIFAKEVLYSYWLQLLIAFILLTGMGFLFFRSPVNPWFKKHRWAALLLIVALGSSIYLGRPHMKAALKSNFNMKGQSVPLIFAEYHGFLFSFFYQMLKNDVISKPDGYSREAIEAITAQYSRPANVPTKSKPNIIIFFIEGFADPLFMDIKTSYDPIPNFRSVFSESVHGTVLSPELGGRSANPEFELLTGLNMRFLPKKSIPYIDHIHHPIPSIAQIANQFGYQSTALHVASLAFFNYRKAYKLLGFDKIKTLHGQPGVQLDPINRFPSEQALVESIIDITENAEQPQFIFSFPNSTHGLWDYDYYLDSSLNVEGNYLEDGKNHLKTYINALHTADKAIGNLIDHYRQSGEPTILLVLGDHQPGLPEFRQKAALKLLKKVDPELSFQNRRALRRAIRTKALTADPEFHQLNHQVPYFIWSNQIIPSQRIDTSMNFLPGLLLEVAQIQKPPMFELLGELRNRMPAVGRIIPPVETQDPILNDYEMIQFDILLGNNYYMSLIEP